MPCAKVADTAAVGEGFVDDLLRRRMLPWIGDGVERVSELRVHVVDFSKLQQGDDRHHRKVGSLCPPSLR